MKERLYMVKLWRVRVPEGMEMSEEVMKGVDVEMRESTETWVSVRENVVKRRGGDVMELKEFVKD